MVEESFMKGFAGAEIVWEIVGNELRTKKIIVLDSSECDYSFTTEDFKFNGVLIPKEKLIFYNRKKAKAKKINKLLDVKELLFQMWCQYIEGFITPVMHGKTDNDVEKLNEKLKDIFFKTSIVTDKDTDILNNESENLEWMSNLDNVRHAIVYKNTPFRYKQLTEEKVHEICKLLYISKLKPTAISKLLSINKTTIDKIS